MTRIVHPKERQKRKTKKATESSANQLLRCSCCGQERKVSQAKILLSLEKLYNETRRDRYGESPSEGWTLHVITMRKDKLIWACDLCIATGKAIRAEPSKQITGLDHPFFAYFDRSLPCTDCGKDFVFSAQEQHYWYDVLQFYIDSYPKQCAACRRKRRIYKRHFHDLQRAIEALDPTNFEQLAQVAEGFLKIGSPQKAIEFLRRARNKAKKESDKDQFAQRIQSIQAELEAGPPGSVNS
jgi:hypothetical protein